MTEAMVGIIMGSDSDLPVMKDAAQVLEELAIPYEITVVSAHRTPQRMVAYAQSAESRGLCVIIAGAGGAAHLPGMVGFDDRSTCDRRADLTRVHSTDWILCCPSCRCQAGFLLRPLLSKMRATQDSCCADFGGFFSCTSYAPTRLSRTNGRLRIRKGT